MSSDRSHSLSKPSRFVRSGGVPEVRMWASGIGVGRQNVTKKLVALASAVRSKCWDRDLVGLTEVEKDMTRTINQI